MTMQMVRIKYNIFYICYSFYRRFLDDISPGGTVFDPDHRTILLYRGKCPGDKLWNTKVFFDWQPEIRWNKPEIVMFDDYQTL